MTAGLSDDNPWNNRLYVGSGHAQAMLVNGLPLLSSDGPAPKPRQVGGPWRDASFAGSTTLWWRSGRDEHLELRWKSGSGSAQIRYGAVRRIHHDLVDRAYDLEVERLENLYGPDIFDDETPGRLASLDDPAGLFRPHARVLATMGMRGTVLDWGTWHATSRAATPMVVWRAAWQSR